MRLLPGTLSGRLLVVLLAVLLTAQLIGAWILLSDRASALYNASGLHTAQRIASIVRVLDHLPEAQRGLFLNAVNGSGLWVRISDQGPPRGALEAGSGAGRVRTVLARLIGRDRPLYVRVARGSLAPEQAQDRRRLPPPQSDLPSSPLMSIPFTFPPPPGGWPPGWNESGWPGSFPAPHAERWGAVWRSGSRDMQVRVATQLMDGSWVRIAHRAPPESLALPGRLLVALAILLLSAVVASLWAVRRVTRPLNDLAVAADALGRDIDRPRLKETGPAEVARAAAAFNTMQTRIARFIKDREGMLAAVSHDLKTPLTRLRLRTELLEDDALKDKILADLSEMESMIGATLDLMRDAARTEPAVAVDLRALVESLAADFEDTGAAVTVEGDFPAAFVARPDALRRCLSNLVENAIKYGGGAIVSGVRDNTGVTLRVTDRGPGIEPDQMERVFEPFVRLEDSRNRDTGGVGLGLAIARGIARAHGGELHLRNRAGGGLEAVLTLPTCV
ncbi:MAG: ATP-binding protein [Leptospirillia bacterium]